MEALTVELPAGPEDWGNFLGPDLDNKVRELDVAHRRIEAAIVGATEHADRTAHYQTDGHRTVATWLMATTTAPARTPQHDAVLPT